MKPRREKLVRSILDPMKKVRCTHGIYVWDREREQHRCSRCDRVMTREEMLDA